jgi:hypothetical protein
MKTLITIALLVMMFLPTLASAQSFQITYPPLPVIGGTYAIRLLVPPDIWWTQLCVDNNLNCPVSGYNPLLWDSTTVADGDHMITVYGYTEGGRVPVAIVGITDPAPISMKGAVTVTLGSIAPNVWWTQLCVDETNNCPAAGYASLPLDTTKLPNGIHDLNVKAYVQNGSTPIAIATTQVNVVN